MSPQPKFSEPYALDQSQPITATQHSMATNLAKTSQLPTQPPSSCSAEWFETLLADVVGMDELKDNLRALRREVVLDAKRRKAGHQIPHSNSNYHMIFKGNPGTGKTTVGRLLAEMLYRAGVLKTNNLVEANRGSLVGSYVGQTAPKTRSKVDEAKGGVLFVDEAYRLSMPTSQGIHDFGLEAIEELQQAMDEEDCPLMIFAGYPQEMDRFVQCNPGLFRRITYPEVLFPDHSVPALVEIFESMVKKSGFNTAVSKEVIASIFRDQITSEQRSALNGGIGSKVFQQAKKSLNCRISETDENPSVSLLSDDIVQGCKALPKPVSAFSPQFSHHQAIENSPKVQFMLPQPC